MSKALKSRQDLDRPRLLGPRSKRAEVSASEEGEAGSERELGMGTGQSGDPKAEKRGGPDPGKRWVLGDGAWSPVGGGDPQKVLKQERAGDPAISRQKVSRPATSTPCWLCLFIL